MLSSETWATSPRPARHLDKSSWMLPTRLRKQSCSNTLRRQTSLLSPEDSTSPVVVTACVSSYTKITLRTTTKGHRLHRPRYHRHRWCRRLLALGTFHFHHSSRVVHHYLPLHPRRRRLARRRPRFCRRRRRRLSLPSRPAHPPSLLLPVMGLLRLPTRLWKRWSRGAALLFTLPSVRWFAS